MMVLLLCNLFLKDLKAKWEAFGWEVVESNGNDFTDLITTIDKAQKLKGQGKPILNLMRTEMGQGIDFMVGTHKWHGVAPNDEQLASALGQLKETLGDY